jgi:hypothetical protein
MRHLTLFLFTLSAHAQLTTISQYVANGDGSPFTGEVVIQVPPFASRSYAVRSRDIWLCSSVNIVTGCAQQIVNGVLTVQLLPNGGGSPSGTSYFVSYYPDVPPGRRPSIKTEYWVVPTGGPYTIDQVKTSTPPVPTVQISPTQLNPTGYATGQFPCIIGGTFLPCSSSGGGVWGSIGGTLSNQTDLQAALNAKAPTAAGWQFVTVDPSGTCTQGSQMRYNSLTARVWGCGSNGLGGFVWQKDNLNPISNIWLRLSDAVKFNAAAATDYVLLTDGTGDTAYNQCAVFGSDANSNAGIIVPGTCLISSNGFIRVLDTMLTFGSGIIRANQVKLVRQHLAALGTCNSSVDGFEGYADDLSAPTFLATAVSGGSVRAKVICNGTNWVVQ